ncbi:unnamed protein product [Effrenium voratum]|uniref:Uncharacterized protein n=1 Tax=Effrenium voratum TaxID=2562239 RepID=A0AA36JT68_9DINO|nr:unnamed protein product [Effrenium voratum]
MGMEPLEMQGVSSGPGEGARGLRAARGRTRAGAAQRSRTCSSLAVLLPLAAVLAAGLVLMLADATAAPDNVVQRAREILIAELRVRTRPANLVVRDFSQTLVDTARGLYRTIEQEAQKVDEHVLLLAGSASRYELMTLTHLEFFYVSRSCMDSANARVHMGKFQLKMKAAALDSAIIYRPSNSLFSRKAPCGAEDFVGQTLLSEPIAARMLLDARYFAGDLRLFQEVQRTIHSWLDLEMAEVAMNHSDITESDLDRWGKNGTMREFLVGEMGSWFIGLELAGRISDMRKGLNVAQRWSVKLQIWRPLLSFAARSANTGHRR